MKISSLVAALVVIATVSMITFVGITENSEAYTFEGSENTVQIDLIDSVAITDTVTVTVNPSNTSG